MGETVARYACERRRARKVACSRERPTCQRCHGEPTACLYLRSGVIRRNRKRNVRATTEQSSRVPPTPHRQPDVDAATTLQSLQSHLTTDIEATQERLHTLDTSPQHALGALSSLAEACTGIWHHGSALDGAGHKFFVFEDRAGLWVDAFITELQTRGPIFCSPPPQVLHHLRSSRPQEVHDRAWLVMYYSITLTTTSSTDPGDESVKAKLRHNLYLSLNSARLLFEPSEANINALILLAMDVETFTKPSLCWMLVTNACRMLQAVGVNNRRLDAQARERRVIMFWHLHLVDIALALIFNRPPSFHRGGIREMPFPDVNLVWRFQGKAKGDEGPGLFAVHHTHQLFQLSRIMADIWDYLHNSPSPQDHEMSNLINTLQTWHQQAQQILTATAIASKPFHAPQSTTLDTSLTNLNIHHSYLFILLSRSDTSMRTQCTEASKEMLRSLNTITPNPSSMLWHLLCAPFTPFLHLLRELLSSTNATQENQDILAAMESLPAFLATMGQYDLAAKLERVAVSLVEYARDAMHSQGWRGEGAIEHVIGEALDGVWGVDMLDWEGFFDWAGIGGGRWDEGEDALS